jgi:hypothetical protein
VPPRLSAEHLVVADAARGRGALGHHGAVDQVGLFLEDHRRR